ncbi:transcriptional regulator [Virgisporangium aliadipatigenens]|uniref:Transcriptional regulator n=1 Tax=Virgisporangium aliadipatigenens TaxID=741659 RepID=A0A8J3YMP9_9ACTN|nr:helix-turn-helix transcriptional regulator [Virgisporangium aliadipatigenens]GIJ46671.1 transcriptional regulator [Virgisporangium aliadipatigenens]
MGQRPRALAPHASPRQFFGAELRWWREHRGLSQTALGALVHSSGATVGKVEKAARRPTADFAGRADAALRTGGVLARLMALVGAEPRPDADTFGGPVDGSDDVAAPDVDRRALLRVVAAAPMAALGGAPSGVRPESLGALTARVGGIHHLYQQGRYRVALRHLPAVLEDLAHRDGAEALLAEAYQVASGLLLKTDDAQLAAVAADRGMAAARQCADPVVVAANARAVVHTLFAGGYHENAVAVAVDAADRLTRDTGTHDEATHSLRGALLLRAAIACAHRGDRHRAGDLLDEASGAARAVGRDGNARWTAFGPTNVRAHRVAVAVEIGDAGLAVEEAAGIDLSALPLPERRAALLVDTARAYVHWGRWERAFDAVRGAERHAPDEVRARRSTHRLIRRLGRGCPASMRPRAHEYARAVGVVR